MPRLLDLRAEVPEFYILKKVRNQVLSHQDLGGFAGTGAGPAFLVLKEREKLKAAS